MSKATVIGDQLLRLVQGKNPGGDEFESEVFLEHEGLPSSRNKFLACNSAVAMHAWRRGNMAEVKSILDWWEWFAGQPFTEHEELTPEEAYRGLQAYSSLVAAALALITNHRGYEKILFYARAHAAWCLVGACSGPGRKVTNHHRDKSGSPVVLVGDGKFSNALPYVAQAGMRGWIRGRASEGDAPDFLFADRAGLSVIVAQATQIKCPRKLAPWQVDLFDAIRSLAPNLPPWGLSALEVGQAQAFLREPENPGYARNVCEWIDDFAPPLPFSVVRYTSGAVVFVMRKSASSSTDACMIDKWEPGGRTEKTSSDDGDRGTKATQRAFEDESAFLCQREDGKGPTMRIAKPSGPEAWRVTCDLGFLRFESGGWHADPTPPTPTPTPMPNPPKKSSGGFWRGIMWGD